MSFKTRAVTGLSFAAVVISCIFAHPYSFSGLFIVITIFCLKELFTHAQKDDVPGQKQFRMWAGIAVAVLPLVAVNYFLLQHLPVEQGMLPLLFVMPVLFFLFFIYELFTKTEAPFTNIAMLALGLQEQVFPSYLSEENMGRND